MWKPSEFFNIQTSVDHLSSKFKELETSYYNYLRRAHKENEKIMKQDSNLGSDFFQNLLKEQEKLELNIKQLGTVKESFNEEISKIKHHIPTLMSKSPSKPDNLGSSNELKLILGINFSKLRDKILNIDEIQRIDRLAKSQVISILEETQLDLSHSLSNIVVLSDVTSPTHRGSSSFKKFEDVSRSNENIFKNCDTSLETMRKKILSTFNETDTKAISFNKDSQHLRENYEVARATILSLIKESKAEPSRYTSPTRTDNSEYRLNVRKAANTLDQALSEIMNSDLKKNKTFMSFKEEFDTLGNRCRSFIKEVSLGNEQLKNNISSLTQQIEEVRTKERMSKTTEGDISRKSSKQVTAFTGDKFSPYRTRPRQEDSAGRNYNSRSVSPLVNKQGGLDGPHSRSKQDLRKEESDAEMNSQLNRARNDFDEVKKEYDTFVATINLKLGHLKTSSRNLIISANKISKFIQPSTMEEELIIKVFENDKKVFDTYLNSLSELLTTQARSPNQAGRHRSHSIDNNAKKEPSPGKKSNTATNFYKSSADDLKANDSKTDSGSKKRFDTAENEDSGRVNQLETDVKSLRHDLASTKAKLEKTAFEKAQMKEEYNNLVHKVKSKGLQTNYVEKIKELSEQNENLSKENAKLNKNCKKLEQKADERKKNLKQLFELLEEKEKELGFYKTGPALGLTNHAERLEDLIKEKSLELESQYQAVEQQLKEKSDELDKLTSFITTISLKYNLLDGRDIDTATFRNENGSGTARKEDKIDLMTEKVIEFDKKRQKLEDLLTSSVTSPQKGQEIRDMISFLNREKEALIQRIKVARSSERNTPSDLASPVVKNLSKEKDFLKDLADKQDTAIQQLKIEKTTLESRINELQEDLKSSVDHRKRVEKNYQDNINVLNKKLQEQAKLIDELTPDSRTSNDEFYKELQEQTNRELFTINSKINELLEFTGDFKEDYSDLKPLNKIERAISNIKRRDYEKKKESPVKRDSTSPKASFIYGESDALKKQISDLEKLVDSYKSSNKLLEKENDEARNEVLLKENEIKKLKLDLQAKGLSNDEHVKQMKTLEVSKNKVQGELDTIFAKLSNLALRFKLGGEEEIKTSYQILEKIEFNLRDFQRTKEEPQAKNTSEAELNKLKKEYKDKEKAFKDQIKELESIVASQEETAESLREELREKEVLLKEMNDRVTNLRELEASQKEEITEKDNEITELKAAKKTTEAKLNEQVNQLNTEKKQRKEDNSLNQLKIDGLTQSKTQLEYQLDKLRKENKELEIKLDELSAKHSEEFDALQQEKEQQLKHKLNLMETSLIEAKKEATRGLQEINENFNKETEKLKVKINTLNQQITQLKDEIGVLNTSNNQLVEEVRQKEEETEEIRTKHRTLSAQKREVDEAFKAKTRELELLQAQYDSLRANSTSSSSEIEKKNRDLAAEKTKLVQEVDTLNIQLQAEQNSVKNHKNTIQALEKKIESLNSHLISHSETHGQELDLKDGLIQKLETDNASLTTRLSEAERQVNDLNNKLKSSNEQINNFKDNLAQKDERLKALQTERDNLEEQKNEVDSRLQGILMSSSSKSDSLQDNLNQANKEIDSLTKQLNQAKQSLDQSKHAQQDLENKLKQKTTEAHDLSESLTKAHNEKNKLVSDNKSKEEALDEKIAQLTQSLNESEGKTKSLKADVQKLNSDLNAIKGEREALIAEKSLLSNQSTKTTEEIASKISEYESLLQNANTKVQSLESELNEEKAQTAQLKKQIEAKEKKISELNDSIQTKESNFTNNIDLIKTELRDLESQNNWLNDELNNKNTDLNNLNAANAEKDNQVKDLQKQLKDLDTKSGQKINQLEEQIKSLTEDNTEKKKKLKQSYSDLQNRIAEYEKERLELTNQIVSTNSDMNSVKTELTKVHQTFEAYKVDTNEKLEDLKSQVKELQKEKETLTKTKNDEIESLNAQLSEKENLGSSNQARIDKLQEDLRFSREEVQNLSEEVTTLNNQLKQKEIDIEQAHTTNKTLEQQKNGLAQQIEQLASSDSKNAKLIEDIKTQRNELEEKVKSLTTELKDLKSKATDDETRINQLTTDLQGKDENIHTVNSQLTQKSQEIESLHGQLAEAEKKLHQTLEQTAQSQEKQIKDLTAEIQTLKSERDELAKTKEALSHQISGKDQAIDERDKTIKAMESDLNDLDKTKTEAENELSKVKAEILEVANRRFFKEKHISFKEESNLYELVGTLGRGMVEYDNELYALREKIVNLEESHSKVMENAKSDHSKDKIELEKNLTTMNEETMVRLKKVNVEIEKIMTEFLEEEIPIDQDQPTNLKALEKAVFENLGSLRQVVRAYKDLKARFDKAQAELDKKKAEFDSVSTKLKTVEESERNLAVENEDLKARSGQLAEIVKKTENEMEEFKKSYSKDRPQIDQREISLNIPEDLDEVKVKSFLEESVRVDRNSQDKIEGVMDEEYIKNLRDQNRDLQDQNDHLINENKAIKSELDMLRILNDELKQEINDHEENTRNMELQLNVIKSELQNVENQKSSSIAHEKAHLRQIFQKFMDSAVKNTKDAPPLFVTFLSLLDMSEKEKNDMIASFKEKSGKKGGVFGKLFKD